MKIFRVDPSINPNFAELTEPSNANCMVSLSDKLSFFEVFELYLLNILFHINVSLNFSLNFGFCRGFLYENYLMDYNIL